MNEKDLCRSLEKLNLERIYLSESPEYRNGERLNRIRQSIPWHIVACFKNYIKNRKIRKNTDAISHYLKPHEIVYADPKQEGLKGVVYTCITGGYDAPKTPLYADPNIQYVLHSDVTLENTDIWMQRSIENVNVDLNSNYANRYYKFHPFELFEGKYDYAMYIDGNVELISDTSSLFSVARDSKLGIAMHRHATMDCAYKNAKWCEYNHRGNIPAIREQVYNYRQEGFPEKFGLLEATIIIFDLNNKCAKDIMHKWWDEFCKTDGRRDQISLPYILWKNGFSIDDIGNLGNDEYHNPKFRIYAHKGKLY